MIVDGSEDIRTFLRMCLLDEGFDVLEVMNVTEALQAVSHFSPDIIILDMRPPFEKEKQFLQEYSERLGYSIPVIGISTAVRFAETAKTLGLTWCFTKPFDLDELLDCILKIIHRT
jgi:DNA-binding response OmpR family regulator